jgi:sugar O-acyltransferase (sialic acid O-acetyltransferase NeuD family)
MGVLDNRVVVFGAGGHAKVILATLQARSEYRVAGLLDDDGTKHGTAFYGCPVLGGRELLAPLRNEGVCLAVLAVGDNDRRAQLASTLKEQGFQSLLLVHPAALILPGSELGNGTVVLAQAFIGADSTIGDNAIVSVQAIVGHDSRVGDCAQICAGVKLGGGADVGDFAFLGLGAVVLPGVKVGRRAIVGANAVVNRDLPDGVTAVGVPARIIDKRTNLP